MLVRSRRFPSARWASFLHPRPGTCVADCMIYLDSAQSLLIYIVRLGDKFLCPPLPISFRHKLLEAGPGERKARRALVRREMERENLINSNCNDLKFISLPLLSLLWTRVIKIAFLLFRLSRLLRLLLGERRRKEEFSFALSQLLELPLSFFHSTRWNFW